MEALQKQLDKVMQNVEILPRKTSNDTKTNETGLVLRKPAARAEVAAIVMKTESRKQLRITQQERDGLIADLLEYEFTVDELKLRGLGVEMANTYGTVALKYWLDEGEVFARETRRLANQIIAERCQNFKNQNIGKSIEEIERLAAEQGLQEVSAYWNVLMQLAVEKHTERWEAKCRRLKAQFFQLPEHAKYDLWAKAVSRGLVADNDKFAMQILPYLIPQMLDDFERSLKESAQKGSVLNV